MASAALLLLAALVVFMTGQSIRTTMRHHFIQFDENVKGMVVGSKVNFQGVPVGAVADIRFEAGKTLVEIAVDPSRAPIQQVTRARLDRLLVTGQVTVELEGWSADSQLVAEGSMIAAKDNPISQLTMSLPDVLAKVDTLVGETNALVGRLNRVLSDDNLARIDGLLANLELATARVPALLETTLPPLAADATASLARLDQLVHAATELVGGPDTAQLVRAARAAFDGVADVAASAAVLGDEARGLVGQNRPSLNAVLLTARDTLRDLQALARRLRAAPSSLLFGVDAAEITVPAAAPGGSR
jgi:phospholipid/cholesterol/gamma-HCH transport system substrate-binding protein